MFYDFPIILGISSSQLTSSHIFQRARAQPPTRYIYIYNIADHNFGRCVCCILWAPNVIFKLVYTPCQQTCISHDGSMVLLYMVTWIPSLYYTPNVSIYIPAPWIRHGYYGWFLGRWLRSKLRWLIVIRLLRGEKTLPALYIVGKCP